MSISLHPDTAQGRTLAAAPAADAAPGTVSSGTKIRSRLFAKYVALFVAVVGVALASNGMFEVFFYYREHKAALIRIQHEQAVAAAAKISQFIKEIESQLGWTTQLPWSAGSIEQRRFDALRLLRQVPAITELAQVDSTGKERLRVSRLAMDVVDSGLDLSGDPKFTEAVAHKVYYGPVYFRRESEPYMTLALAGTRKDAGVSIAEVNLKLIWDVVSQIKVGEHGHAYVVGAQGRLIAHPDISLVLRNTDMSKLVQVQAAQAGTDMESLQGARNIQGQEVLTASAPILPLRWTMFVELPVEEAYASLYAALQRLAIVLAAASIFAVLAGIFLARRMVGPIQALRAGAERIGGGDFTQRISIPTGDELEGLADQFNDMGARLQESYADLEKKVETRTAELTESLEQQTATAEILSSISASMTDTKPVFDAIVRNLRRLFGTRFSVLQTLRDDGMVEMPAVDGDPGFEKLIDRYPRPLSDDTVGGLAMLSRHPVQYSPVLGNPATPVTTQQFARDFGFDSVIFTPMLLRDRVIGAIGVARREAAPFDEKQIALIGSFANQAVIAIENTRLLKELRARTDDLSESLEQQTATSEVLKVISSSPGELDPVFQTMLANATRICEANFGMMYRYDHGAFHPAALLNVPPALAKYVADRGSFLPPPGTPLDRLFRTREIIYTADGTAQSNPGVPATLGGARSLVGVPMLKDNELVGAIIIYRQEVRPFTDKQVELVRSFASQAVIAIENTRLLKELRQRTDDLSESLEQQTATSEVLEIISSSPGELEPVFQKMLENATRVCGAKFGVMGLFEGDTFRRVAVHNLPPMFAEMQRVDAWRPNPEGGLGTVARTKQVAHIDDLRTSGPYVQGDQMTRILSDLAGARTLVVVPMLKEGELIGAISIFRQEVKPFTDKQIALVSNFANQAVIAIENTRLLKELRARTTELSLSLDDLRTAQDRLVQTEKLASLGQLTAGIAHEIKNPLNFVNNFSAVSVELIDEMNEVLKDLKLDGKKREEIDELAHMLKGNLEKVVQHGKRADSIVKNMLLHSREGAGEHRPADINAIVEESLNLAYHGARAEKSGFNITLKRDLDPKAGMIDLYPQEVTRVLLNLISNGFYAATKRKEAGVDGFEPTLSAATKNLGNSVEIRIRDNGTGIPSEVKEKMFNPFFTTKPAGEGTGLGLSMSHDIVVKQHGGKIDVNTEAGSFTEFIITLPRTMAARANAGGVN
ncbi:MAG: GAF domain-containing protein [Bradyrhizobium sp.]|jgi:signal transduction histidine kinase